MIDFLRQFLVPFGGIAAIAAVVGLLAGYIIKHLLKKDLEKHKEALRAEANVLLHEQQLRFSVIYERREKLLAELVKELNSAIDSCLGLFLIHGEAHFGPAREKLSRLHAMMFDASLYFDRDFCDRWHKSVSDTETSMIRWLAFQNKISTETPEARKQRMELHDQYLAALQVLRGELIERVRVLIGVTSQKA